MAEFSQEESDKLVQSFKDLGVKPKTDSKEDLEQWMLSYLQESGKLNVPVKAESFKILPSTRLPAFSGEEKDTPYDLWKYEVQCLVSGNGENTALQALRRSLRSSAARVVMGLGNDVSVKFILEKLDGIYGEVDRSEDLLASYYSTSQKEGETVAAWGCRLENILRQVETDSRFKMPPELREETMKLRFHSGLKPDIKLRSLHKLDICKTFDTFRVEVRKLEHELQQDSEKKTDVKKNRATINQVTTAGQETEDGSSSRLTEKVDKLEVQINKLTQLMTKQIESRPHQTQQRNQRDHYQQNRPDKQQSQGQNRDTAPDHQGNWVSRQPLSEVTCFRCNQKGHLARGCRVILDHQKCLNDKKPMNGADA